MIKRRAAAARPATEDQVTLIVVAMLTATNILLAFASLSGGLPI